MSREGRQKDWKRFIYLCILFCCSNGKSILIRPETLTVLKSLTWPVFTEPRHQATTSALDSSAKLKKKNYSKGLVEFRLIQRVTKSCRAMVGVDGWVNKGVTTVLFPTIGVGFFNPDRDRSLTITKEFDSRWPSTISQVFPCCCC